MATIGFRYFANQASLDISGAKGGLAGILEQEKRRGSFATDAQLNALEGAIRHLESALCCIEDYTNAKENE